MNTVQGRRRLGVLGGPDDDTSDLYRPGLRTSNPVSITPTPDHGTDSSSDRRIRSSLSYPVDTGSSCRSHIPSHIRSTCPVRAPGPSDSGPETWEDRGRGSIPVIPGFTRFGPNGLLHGPVDVPGTEPRRPSHLPSTDVHSSERLSDRDGVVDETVPCLWTYHPSRPLRTPPENLSRHRGPRTDTHS